MPTDEIDYPLAYQIMIKIKEEEVQMNHIAWDYLSEIQRAQLLHFHPELRDEYNKHFGKENKQRGGTHHSSPQEVRFKNS